MEGMGCLVIKQTYGKSNDIELTFLILNLYIWNIKKNVRDDPTICIHGLHLS